MEDFGSRDGGIANDLFKSHRNFGLMARRELDRAERYCSYLSLLVIDIEESAGEPSVASDNGAKLEWLLEGIHRLILRSVRKADIVSGFEERRCGLLLAETPRNGAATLTERLRLNFDDFLRSNRAAGAGDLKMRFKTLSFPDPESSKDEVVGTIQEFIKG